MKQVFILLILLFNINAMADKNKCLLKGICTCEDYVSILNDKLINYNNSVNKNQRELRILSVNSYMNSLYSECKNTKYYKKDIVQKNKQMVKNRLKIDVRPALRNIKANKPLY